MFNWNQLKLYESLHVVENFIITLAYIRMYSLAMYSDPLFLRAFRKPRQSNHTDKFFPVTCCPNRLKPACGPGANAVTLLRKRRFPRSRLCHLCLASARSLLARYKRTMRLRRRASCIRSMRKWGSYLTWLCIFRYFCINTLNFT